MSARNDAQILAEGFAKLFSGDLWIDDATTGIQFQDAVMYTAAAQLRAISIAISISGEVPHDGDGVEGWESGVVFTRHDATAAIGGVASLLSATRAVIHTVRENLPEPTATKGEAAE